MPRILLRRAAPQCESHLTSIRADHGEWPAPFLRRTEMRPHITENGPRSISAHARAAVCRATLVIMAALYVARATAADAAEVVSTAGAPLATVVIDGGSVYPAPRLFAAYRGQLGQPVSRDAARIIAAALVAMYEQDGYARPEVVVDDSLGTRGLLRLHVHEAQVTRVIFSGNSG